MASKRAFSSLSNIAKLASPAPVSTTRALLPSRRLPVSVFPSSTIRLAHTIPRPRKPSPFTQQQNQPQSTTTQPPEATTTPSSPTQQQKPQPNILQQPHYELTFTCVPCGTRSRHRVSKQGYHHGTVLIACPSCRNRHVIADHLRVFGDKAMTVEDILREKGELIKRGTIAEGGDLEFWEDGTTSVREPWVEKESKWAKEGEDLPPGATFKTVKPGEKGTSGEGV